MEMNVQVVDELKKVFPELTTMEGKILWGVFVNRDIVLPNGEVMAGSFRWWGARIAEVVGEGDYLDYYMGSSFAKMILSIMGDEEAPKIIEEGLKKKLIFSGWKIEEHQVYCDICGNEIDRMAPKGLGLRDGKTRCVDCLVT